MAWGASIGEATARVVTTILARQPHPEQGYRACLGLLALSRRYNRTRLDAASVRALASGAVSYRTVKSILATGLDQLPLEAEPPRLHLPATHDHVRGAAYYHTCLTLDAPSADMSAVEPDVLPDVLTLCGESAC